MRFTVMLRDAFVRQVMGDVPQTDYKELIRSEVNKQAEAYRRAAGITPDMHERLMHRSTNNIFGDVWCTTFALLNQEVIKIQGLPQIAEWEKLGDAQTEKLRELESTLRAALESCSTVKKVAERFPEFEKYLPKEEPSSANLPALANVVTSFVKAGWPKDVKKIGKRSQAAA